MRRTALAVVVLLAACSADVAPRGVGTPGPGTATTPTPTPAPAGEPHGIETAPIQLRPAPMPEPGTTPPTATGGETQRLGAVPPSVVAGVRLAEVWNGLARPVALASPPGDASRIYVLEQLGRVRLIRDRQLVPAPVLDLTGGLSRGNEQGLLGLAFHPKFATTRKVYLHYTDRDDTSRVVEYTFAPGVDATLAPTTRREVLAVEQPYSNHNGGHLAFGPDGKLWVGFGDGGSAGDPKGYSQRDNTRLGKMLRIDVDAAKPVIETVYKGLRNPWRYGFDAKTGDLYIGDVGQDKWEMVYVVAADDRRAHNFGWNVVEGRHCFDAKTCDRTRFTAPVADYPHEEGCSITGGLVYRGQALPALDGVYFYADYCTALIRSFRWRAAPTTAAGGTIRDHWDWRPALDPEGQLGRVSSFGVDGAGELYVLSLAGSIYQFVAAPPAP